MFFNLEDTLLGLELASQSYQWILQESNTIDLLSIQIDKGPIDKYEIWIPNYKLQVLKWKSWVQIIFKIFQLFFVSLWRLDSNMDSKSSNKYFI